MLAAIESVTVTTVKKDLKSLLWIVPTLSSHKNENNACSSVNNIMVLMQRGLDDGRYKIGTNMKKSSFELEFISKDTV
jgi:hypothetical protein